MGSTVDERDALTVCPDWICTRARCEARALLRQLRAALDSRARTLQGITFVHSKDDIAGSNSSQLSKPTLDERHNNHARAVWCVANCDAWVDSRLLLDVNDAGWRLTAHVLLRFQLLHLLSLAEPKHGGGAWSSRFASFVGSRYSVSSLKRLETRGPSSEVTIYARRHRLRLSGADTHTPSDASFICRFNGASETKPHGAARAPAHS